MSCWKLALKWWWLIGQICIWIKKSNYFCAGVYKLETSITSTSHWFDINWIKSNQAKFLAMILNNRPNTSNISPCVNDLNIPLKPRVKLLGVFIDNETTYSDRATYVCKRASGQLIAVRRMAKYWIRLPNENTPYLSTIQFQLLCDSVTVWQCDMSLLNQVQLKWKQCISALPAMFNY